MAGHPAPVTATDSAVADYVTEVDSLHDLCGIYTRDSTARDMLASIGWSVDADLSRASLLDPCVGDGAFVAPAAEILVGSLRRAGLPLVREVLRDRILGFEIHAREADKAKRAVRDALARAGVDGRIARGLANAWVRHDDFLLHDFGQVRFTHLVANPPYLRWVNLPPGLSAAYRSALPRASTTGDLCVAFIARMIDLAESEGRIALLSSDRWLHSAYAEGFRAQWANKVRIEDIRQVNPRDVFDVSVSAYPVVAILSRQARGSQGGSLLSSAHWLESSSMAVYEGWKSRFGTIEEAGCEIRVGPALGHEKAFVDSTLSSKIEEELLVKYVRPREIIGDKIKWEGDYALNVWTPAAGLIDLDQYPKAARHLDTFRSKLKVRSCVKGVGKKSKTEWYRTIDRTDTAIWSRPKILIPEICRIPRVALDAAGHQPSHGIYALFSCEWPLGVLRDLLAAGVLGLVMDCIAPRLNGDYRRCYKRFLSCIPLPLWGDLANKDRALLVEASRRRDRARLMRVVAQMYSVDIELLSAHATEDWRKALS